MDASLPFFSGKEMSVIQTDKIHMLVEITPKVHDIPGGTDLSFRLLCVSCKNDLLPNSSLRVCVSTAESDLLGLIARLVSCWEQSNGDPYDMRCVACGHGTEKMIPVSYSKIHVHQKADKV